MSATLTLLAALSIGAPALKDKEPLGSGPGYLGIVFQKDGEGLTVTEVKADGPAHKAGLKEGDVIFKIDDADFKDSDTGDLVKFVGGMRPGTIVNVAVQRGTQKLVVKVKLTGRPPDFQPVPTRGIPPIDQRD
ncbi:MAG TPA: PDZ domain-containing protein [Gemmataceae bacterium]|nr:PDZ domain-containing protein [Gemmataceae bacterium]